MTSLTKIIISKIFLKFKFILITLQKLYLKKNAEKIFPFQLIE